MSKIKFGLKNVHYAVITNEETLTYGEVKKLKGAVKLSLSPEGESSPFFADDHKYYVSQSNNGYSGDLEIAILPDDFKKEVLGYIEDKTTGGLVEIANVQPKPIALMYEFQNDDSSRRVVVFKAHVARPSLDHETKTESIDPQTETLTIEVIPVEKGSKGKIVSQLIIKKGAAGYNNLFSSVPTLDDIDGEKEL